MRTDRVNGPSCAAVFDVRAVLIKYGTATKQQMIEDSGWSEGTIDAVLVFMTRRGLVEQSRRGKGATPALYRIGTGWFNPE